MDILAHILWSWAMLRKCKQFWLVAIASVLPDLLAFGPHFAASLMDNGFSFGAPELHSLPPYVFSSYNVTHSLVICALAFGLIYLLQHRIPLWLLGWPIHILIDIPTHTDAFFPTPALWPLSDIYFNGISWGTPWFMILNYSTLALVYLYLYTRNGKTLRARSRKNKA